MYSCDDSCADSLIENDTCDEIYSLSSYSSNSSSFVTYAFDSTLELKPLLDSLKYVFLGPSETFSMIIASNLNEDQESKLLKVLRKTKEVIG